MDICCDCHKPFMSGKQISISGQIRPVCNSCYERLQKEVGKAIYASNSTEAKAILTDHANSGLHSAVVANGLFELYYQASVSKCTRLDITVVSNGQTIGLSSGSGRTIMRQDDQGRVFFDSSPNSKFYLEDYSWNGPLYKNVTVSQTSGGIKSRDKTKTKEKRKGGFVGAAVGTVLLPGVGTAIGYAATSKKVAKGKGKGRTKDNTRVVTEENAVEIDSTASIKLRDIATGRVGAIGIKCNTEIDIDLDRFDWSAIDNNIYANAEIAADVEVITETEKTPVQQITGPSEMNVISLLKEYKSLLDAGIIDESEFQKKKAELLNK